MPIRRPEEAFNITDADREFAVLAEERVNVALQARTGRTVEIDFTHDPPGVTFMGVALIAARARESGWYVHHIGEYMLRLVQP